MLLRGNLEDAAVVSRRRRQSIAARRTRPGRAAVVQTRNTIEKLFAAIDRSLPPYGETKSTVQYDGALGFPQVADLDPQRESIDDELYFRVTGFRVIEK